MDRLTNSRDAIDRLDREFIRLLAERMRVVRDIGSFKGENLDAPLRDETRERAMFDVWAQEAERAGLSGYYAGRVLREILAWSRRDQERFLEQAGGGRASKLVRVGYQGVPACYSDLAITKIFATRELGKLERIGFRSFSAAVEALQAGEVQYALLPIENTIAGSINEVYDLLAEHPLTIVGEEVWEVEHCLMALPGASFEDIRTIRSHPVALQQCERFLDGLVGVVVESHHDTAGAAQSIARERDPSVAAIASEEAAREYGLQVVRRDIADHARNLTRFLLLAKEAEPIDARRAAKTSLLLSVSHRRGALLECLQAFDKHGLNLCKLESRPQATAPWQYLFYVDLEGNTADERVQAALAEVRAHTHHLKVLGCYPRRTDRESDSFAASAVQTAPVEVANDVRAPAGEKPATCSVPATPKPANPNLRLCSSKEGGVRTRVQVGNVEIGGDRFVLIIGPCAVETRTQVLDAAAMAKKAGASILRGGAFKPRTSPYAFQGLGFPGLELLVEAGRAYELPVVTEVLQPEDVERVAASADMLQVGARNMQNFSLLREVGKSRRPVLLKRGMSATIEELLLAAEYIMAGGNTQVVLCERGIRTFETATRNTLDLSAIPVLKARTHLPVIVDPSHAAGLRELVVPLSLAAAAVGADGLIVEAHPNPAAALCDKDQALTSEDLAQLTAALRPIVQARGRTL
ncbi:MAG: bifunctional 3-deoxy-7-phosphoheptulonate synthase/chorismate mutase [Planctomycetota bacterium]